MFVKKFEAASLEQALARVKSEMGPNALILSTQAKRGKWLQKGRVEVTAAFEKRMKAQIDQRFDEEELRRVFPDRNRVATRPPETRVPASPKSTRRTPEPVETKANTRYMDMTDTKTSGGGSNEVDPHRYEKDFLSRGFSAESARELSRRLVFDYPKKDLADAGFVGKTKTKLVAAHLRSLPAEIFNSKSCWAAIGLPGSGKTSLLVKLALYLKTNKKSAQLVSLDSRKVSGRSEMAAYAKLLGLPFTHENNPVAAVSCASLQLVDTPALSLRSEKEAEEMERICRNRNVLLVLDASSRLTELMKTVEASHRYAPSAIAFTRLDLVSEPGVIFDVLKQSKLPLFGLSMNGQLKKSFRFYEAMDLAGYLLNGQSANTAAVKPENNN